MVSEKERRYQRFNIIFMMLYFGDHLFMRYVFYKQVL